MIVPWHKTYGAGCQAIAADTTCCRPPCAQVFLNRVAAHPVLCKSPDLQLFLEATEDTWAVEMARGQVRVAAAPHPPSRWR